MGKLKTTTVSREAEFKQALSILIPQYIDRGAIKRGDWIAVLVMDEGGGRCGAAIAPAADQEEARLSRRQFQDFAKGRADYIGSASIQVQ